MDAAILDARTRVADAERLRARMARAAQEREELAHLLAGAEADVEREGIDVERLRGARPLALWMRILGRLDERRAEDEAQHAAAIAHYDALYARWEDAGKSHDRAAPDLAALDDAEAQLRHPIDAHASGLVAAGDTKARAALDRAAEARIHLQEIAETGRATHDALQHAQAASRKLDEAAGWGTADMIVGGLFVTMIKHGKIDDARTRSTVCRRRWHG